MSGVVGKTEAAVLDLFDRGYNATAIAAELGKSKRQVDILLNRNFDSSSRAYEAMVRRGSRALLEAISRHHPERITGGAQ